MHSRLLANELIRYFSATEVSTYIKSADGGNVVLQLTTPDSEGCYVSFKVDVLLVQNDHDCYELLYSDPNLVRRLKLYVEIALTADEIVTNVVLWLDEYCERIRCSLCVKGRSSFLVSGSGGSGFGFCYVTFSGDLLFSNRMNVDESEVIKSIDYLNPDFFELFKLYCNQILLCDWR